MANKLKKAVRSFGRAVSSTFGCGCCGGSNGEDAFSGSDSDDDDGKERFVEVDLLRPDLNRARKYPRNTIRTAKYTLATGLPLSLLYQFRKVSNFYFLLVMVISLVPGASPINPFSSVAPLCVVLGAGIIKDLWEDWKRRTADRKANEMVVHVLRDGGFTPIRSCDIDVGDVMLFRLGEEVKADCLILNTSLPDGLTYIETANLDGETNAKTRRARIQTVEQLGTVEDIIERSLGTAALDGMEPFSASETGAHVPPTAAASERSRAVQKKKKKKNAHASTPTPSDDANGESDDGGDRDRAAHSGPSSRAATRGEGDAGAGAASHGASGRETSRGQLTRPSTTTSFSAATPVYSSPTLVPSPTGGEEGQRGSTATAAPSSPPPLPCSSATTSGGGARAVGQASASFPSEEQTTRDPPSALSGTLVSARGGAATGTAAPAPLPPPPVPRVTFSALPDSSSAGGGGCGTAATAAPSAAHIRSLSAEDERVRRWRLTREQFEAADPHAALRPRRSASNRNLTPRRTSGAGGAGTMSMHARSRSAGADGSFLYPRYRDGEEGIGLSQTYSWRRHNAAPPDYHTRYETFDERLLSEGVLPLPREQLAMSRQYEEAHSRTQSVQMNATASGGVFGLPLRSPRLGGTLNSRGAGTATNVAVDGGADGGGGGGDAVGAAGGLVPRSGPHSGVVILGSLPSPDLSSWFGQVRLPDSEVVPVGIDQFLPRGCIVRNTDWVLGAVMYTGKHTKMLLNLRPKPNKTTVMTRRLNQLNICLFALNQVMMLTLCGIAVLYKHRLLKPEPGSRSGWSTWYIQWNLERYSDVKLFWWRYLTNFVLLSYLIPMSLYVTLEFNKAMQMLMIAADKRMAVYDEFSGTLKKARPKTSELNCQLAHVQYIFTDKTGTLTENLMTYVGGYAADVSHDEREKPGGLGRLFLRSVLLAAAATVNHHTPTTGAAATASGGGGGGRHGAGASARTLSGAFGFPLISPLAPSMSLHVSPTGANPPTPLPTAGNAKTGPGGAPNRSTAASTTTPSTTGLAAMRRATLADAETLLRAAEELSASYRPPPALTSPPQQQQQQQQTQHAHVLSEGAAAAPSTRMEGSENGLRAVGELFSGALLQSPARSSHRAGEPGSCIDEIPESILEEDELYRYLRAMALCHSVVCFDVNDVTEDELAAGEAEKPLSKKEKKKPKKKSKKAAEEEEGKDDDKAREMEEQKKKKEKKSSKRKGSKRKHKHHTHHHRSRATSGAAGTAAGGRRRSNDAEAVPSIVQPSPPALSLSLDTDALEEELMARDHTITGPSRGQPIYVSNAVPAGPDEATLPNVASRASLQALLEGNVSPRNSASRDTPQATSPGRGGGGGKAAAQQQQQQQQHHERVLSRSGTYSRFAHHPTISVGSAADLAASTSFMHARTLSAGRPQHGRTGSASWYLNRFTANTVHQRTATMNTNTILNPIDDWIDRSKIYEGQSLDEIALVSAARENGFSLYQRTAKQMFVKVLDKLMCYDIIAELEFTPQRKLMSILLQRNPDGDSELHAQVAAAGSNAHYHRKGISHGGEGDEATTSSTCTTDPLVAAASMNGRGDTLIRVPPTTTTTTAATSRAFAEPITAADSTSTTPPQAQQRPGQQPRQQAVLLPAVLTETDTTVAAGSPTVVSVSAAHSGTLATGGYTQTAEEPSVFGSPLMMQRMQTEAFHDRHSADAARRPSVSTLTGQAPYGADGNASVTLTGAESGGAAQPPLSSSPPTHQRSPPVAQRRPLDRAGTEEGQQQHQNTRLPNGTRNKAAADTTTDDAVSETSPVARDAPSIGLEHRDDSRYPYLLLVKGADSSMMSIVDNSNPRNVALKPTFITQLDSMAKTGLRTLVLGQRYLTSEEVTNWLPVLNEAQCSMHQRSERMHEAYALLERDIDLVGTTAVEDKLQEGVPETLEFFSKASIVVWMLTGDKRETAVTIAQTSGLVSAVHDDCVVHLDISDLLAEEEATRKAENHNHHHQQQHQGPSSSPPPQETAAAAATEGGGAAGATAAGAASPTPATTNTSTTTSGMAGNGKNGGSASTPPGKGESTAPTTRGGAGSSRVLSPLQTEMVDRLNQQMSTAEELCALKLSELGEQPVVVVVDGKTLDFIFQDNDRAHRFFLLGSGCRSAVCCRMTPLQKAQIVRLFQKNMKAVALAVGDGANDVSMIQESKIGVGIMGLEGSQAELASDYAIPKFRFLKRLLMVHGRFSLYREAHCILYSLYKNVILTVAMISYTLFCAASGQAFIDSWLLAMFSIFFCSLQPLVIGILDKDVEDELAESLPQLYPPLSREDMYFSVPYILKWLSDGVVEGFAFYFFLIYTAAHFEDLYKFRSGGIEDYGETFFTMMVLVVDLRVAILVTYYMVIFFAIIIFEIVFLPVAEILYSEIHNLAGSNWCVYTAHALYGSGKFYLFLFFAVGVLVVYTVASNLYIQMFSPWQSAGFAMRAAKASPYRVEHQVEKERLKEELRRRLQQHKEAEKTVREAEEALIRMQRFEQQQRASDASHRDSDDDERE